jgi:sugar lactone lactonase YvrE
VIEFREFNPVRSVLGEGPHWSSALNELWWVDTRQGVLHRASPEDGRTTSVLIGGRLGFAVEAEDGSTVIGLQDGIAQLGEPSPVATVDVAVEQDEETASVNDGKCDPRGRLLFGTLTLGQRTGTPVGKHYLYQLDVCDVRIVLEGVQLSNGMGWSPDGSRFYYVDSVTQRIAEFEYDVDSGTLGARSVFAEIAAEDGLPDGLCVDSEGYVWLALYGGGQLRRYAPTGKLDARIDLPVRYPTSCAFGGPDLATLFVTSGYLGFESDGGDPGELDGAVLVGVPGVSGLAPTLCNARISPRAQP